MKQILSMAFATIVVTVLAARVLNAQNIADPRIGSWAEQRTSGDFDSLLRVSIDAGAGMTRMIVNAKLQEANRPRVDFRCDGAPYRLLTYDGRFAGLTYACRRTGARRFDFSSKREPADPDVSIANGATGAWVTAGGTETVSTDGRTYDTTAVLRFADGQTRQSRKQFIRRTP